MKKPKEIPYRLDHKTVVFAPEGSDIEVLKKKYLEKNNDFVKVGGRKHKLDFKII